MSSGHSRPYIQEVAGACLARADVADAAESDASVERQVARLLQEEEEPEDQWLGRKDAFRRMLRETAVPKPRDAASADQAAKRPKTAEAGPKGSEK